MNNLDENLNDEGACNSHKYKDNLVLTINNEGKIIKFNEICEQISGYRKDDILNNDFFDQLIPNRYFDLWLNFFDNSQQNKMLHDFKLPLKTKNGHEIMISWSSFPIKNSKKDKIDIDLIGSIISSWKDFETPKIDADKNISKEKPKSKTIFNKKIRISKNNPKLIDKFKSLNNELEKRNKILENQLKKYESINNPMLIEKLKSLNTEFENRNKILEKQLKEYETREEHLKDRLDKAIKQSNVIVNKGLYSFSELYGGKKRKEEFETKEKELKDREEILNRLEKKLLNDKEKINNQFYEFQQWRERLESLEDDIEKRRMDLMNQEKMLLSDITGSDDVSVSETTKEDLKRSYDVFEKISDSAAIIQRGIFKRVNDSFSDLIGYNFNEIINRSLFDFISPDGFTGMEKYYLNRLKGENVSTYKTVILSKDNIKIPVEINSNPTFIDGEKAEIAVFKNLEDQAEKIVDEIKKDNKIDNESVPKKIENDELDLDEPFEKDESVKEPLEDENLTDKDIEGIDEKKLEKPSSIDSKEIVDDSPFEDVDNEQAEKPSSIDSKEILDDLPEEEVGKEVTSSETVVDEPIENKDLDEDDIDKEIKDTSAEDIDLEDESKKENLSDKERVSQEEIDETIKEEDLREEIDDSKKLEDSDIDTDLSKENIDKKKVNDEKEKKLGGLVFFIVLLHDI